MHRSGGRLRGWWLGVSLLALLSISIYGVYSSAVGPHLDATRDALHIGRYDLAEAELDRVSDWWAWWPAVVRLRSLSSLAQQLHDARPDWQSIERQLERMRGEDPREPVLLVLGAALEIKSGRFNDAMEALKAALVEEPGYAEAAYMLGYIADLQCETASAVEHYHQAMQLSPASFRYRNNLAHAYLVSGRLDAALREYDRIPQFPLARAEQAMAYWVLGKPKAAAQQQRLALELLGDDALMAAPSNRVEWVFTPCPASIEAEGVRLSTLEEKRCYVSLGLWASRRLADPARPWEPTPGCDPVQPTVRRLVAADLCRYVEGTPLSAQVGDLRLALGEDSACLSLQGDREPFVMPMEPSP